MTIIIIIFYIIAFVFIVRIARKRKQPAQKKNSIRSNIQVKANSAPPRSIQPKPAAAPSGISLASPTARLQCLDRKIFENREGDWLAKQIKEERANKGMF